MTNGQQSNDGRNFKDWVKANGLAVVALVLLLGGALAVIVWPLIQDRSNILQRLADEDFARGVITYLITVGTVTIALALVAGLLLGSAQTRNAFKEGKDVLAVLVGVLGTILGFYFGSAEGGRPDLTIATDSTDFAAGDSLRIAAHISGGESPYTYNIVVDPDTIGAVGPLVTEDGWVYQAIALPADISPLAFTLTAHDSGGHSETIERHASPD